MREVERMAYSAEIERQAKRLVQASAGDYRACRPTQYRSADVSLH
jgi:hypothetical protein